MYLDDESYLRQFAQRKLGPEHFDHTGHLRMGWLHLKYFDQEEAIERVCNGIRDLATQFGAPQKFHYTLSEALLRIMARRMQQGEDFASFLQRNSELLEDAKGVLANHYSPQRLDSAPARAGWLPPDREPLG